MGDTTYDAPAGTLVIIPPGAPHTVANLGDGPAALLKALKCSGFGLGAGNSGNSGNSGNTGFGNSGDSGNSGNSGFGDSGDGNSGNS